MLRMQFGKPAHQGIEPNGFQDHADLMVRCRREPLHGAGNSRRFRARVDDGHECLARWRRAAAGSHGRRRDGDLTGDIDDVFVRGDRAAKLRARALEARVAGLRKQHEHGTHNSDKQTDRECCTFAR